jgi:protein-S-isoprenylcysteine O-methyltransferase Ste14
VDWFRRAAPASTGALLARTFIQIVIFWGVFLFIAPPLIARGAVALGAPALHLPGARPVALVLFLVASMLGLASAWTMVTLGRGTPLPLDGPRLLVTRGPYHWLRNPMAVAGMAQGVAAALWLGSVPVLLYVVAGGVLWHALVRPVEEADLLSTFGETYETYRRRVPLWIPESAPRRRGDSR